jgi:hypothetical protein
MSQWGEEDQLFAFGRDAEGVLEEGVRRPKGEGQWVDALAFAKGF